MTQIDSSAIIHPTAIVEPGAIIGAETVVGPYSVIGPRVVLGRGNVVRSHVVIDGCTEIGEANSFFQFASIGSAPQDLKYHGEESRLQIGSRNIVREYVTIQPGTEGGGMQTTVGNGNLFMACSHVGHDAHVGNGNVFANSCALAGHVTIENGVIIGGLCGIHQFVRVGSTAMLGGGAMVNKDVPPYCLAQGDRAVLAGINSIGLQRSGWSPEEIAQLKRCYHRVFLAGGSLSERVERARAEFASADKIMSLLDFIAASERGITPVRRGKARQ